MEKILVFGALIAWLSLAVTVLFGWVMNILTLLGAGYETLAQTIVGAIGVLVGPVGALVYYVAG